MMVIHLIIIVINNTFLFFSFSHSFLFLKIGCCGVHGQSDFKNQKGWDRKWINQETKRNRQAKIPATCCMFKSSAPDIMGMRTEQQFLKYLIRPDCPVSRRQSHHEVHQL